MIILLLQNLIIEFAKIFEVLLPICKSDVVRLTLEPTFAPIAKLPTLTVIVELLALNEPTTNSSWYGRYPVFCDNDIFFVAGNDLFKLAHGSKTPELFFQSTGNLSNLIGSGQKIFCVSDEDGGPDIYVFDIKNRTLKRLTFFENSVRIVEVVNDGILFLSNKNSPFKNNMYLYKYLSTSPKKLKILR